MSLDTMARLLSASLLLAALLVPMALAPLPTVSAQTSTCPTPSASKASASSSAMPIQVLFMGAPVLTQAAVSSSQTGVGRDADTAGPVDTVTFPPVGDPIVTANVLSSATSAEVKGSPIKALASARSEVASLNVMDGLVQAEVVRGAVRSTAEPNNAFTDNQESTIENLRVNGEFVSFIEPGEHIPLPPEAAGEGSFVRVHQRIDTSRQPTAAVPFYKGEAEVRMIHIVLTDVSSMLDGEQRVDILVAQAKATAQSPAVCGQLRQSVAGAAYSARVWPQGWFEPYVTQGYQSIGVNGGTAGQALADENWTFGGNTFTAELAKTHVVGKVIPGERSGVYSLSRIEGLCLEMNGDPCFISADVMQTVAAARADPDDARHWGNTIFVNLQVGGVDVCPLIDEADGPDDNTCSPKPNTRKDIMGLHFTFNEQWGDTPEPGRTGVNVRALRVENGDPQDPEQVVLIARSYAAARYNAPSM